MLSSKDSLGFCVPRQKNNRRETMQKKEVKIGNALMGVELEPISKDEVMVRYRSLPVEFLTEQNGTYGLSAQQAIATRYRLRDPKEHSVSFEVHGLCKLIAGEKTHWPLEELVSIIDDENPHLYRLLARGIARAISANGRAFGVDARYGVLPGTVYDNGSNKVEFTISTDGATHVMLYTDRPLNWIAGMRNWDVVKVHDEHGHKGFYATFIPLSIVSDTSINI